MKYLFIIILFRLTMMDALGSLKGPQFEGWYTRLIDHENNRSIALIGGSFLPKKEKFEPGKPLKGYLAVIYQDDISSKAQVYEEFIDKTTFLSDGLPIMGHNEYSLESTYEWKAPGYGEITNKHIDIEIKGKIKISAQIDSFDPFPGGFDQPAYFFKIKEPIRWHVYNLGSTSYYQMTLMDHELPQTLIGKAITHQEKNWGMTFPQKWIWMEGVSNKAKFAMSGGTIHLLNFFPVRASTLGIKMDYAQWYFDPLSIKDKIKMKVDSCQKKVLVTARKGDQVIKMFASAPQDSFFYLSVPTKNGFIRDGAIESFKASVKILVYQKRQLQEELEFHQAALEFGGEFMNCP